MKLLALVLVAACSNLQQITPECGNGIIEPGEDCDSGPDCLQCSIRCTVGVDGQHSQDCPDQVTYTCGADQLCHAPGGRFHDATAGFAFPAQGFGVTDINSDGFGDVVALSGTSLTVNFGDTSGELATQTSTVVPFLGGAPAVTHLDPDLTLDIVMPTADGLVAFTSRYHVLAPYPFPVTIPIPMNSGIRLGMTFPLDGHYIGTAVISPAGLAVYIIDGTQKDPMKAVVGTTLLICTGFDASKFDAQASSTYDTGTVGAPSHVVSFGSKASASLCAVNIVPNGGLTAYTVTEFAPAGIPIANAPILARLDASPCPSVIDSAGDGAATQYHATGTAGSCGVTATNPTSIAFDPGTVVVGRVPLIPTLAGQGPDALAVSDGVYAIAGAVTTRLFESVRPIVAIESLDVDGDGDVDAVATAGPMFSDLEVLYRYGTNTTTDLAGFLPVDVGTVGSPNNLVVGDFDGDGIGDITYSENLTNGERLMIAFGSRDQIQPPTQVSTYSDIQATSTIGLANSSDPTGTKVADLIVMDQVSGSTFLTILFGSPQRSLVPFFDPRQGVAGSLGFRGALAGNFDGMATGYQELVTVESFMGGARVWLLDPNSDGSVLPPPSVSTPDLDLGDCTGMTQFCIDGSSFVAWHGATGQRDVVVGLERRGTAPFAHRIITLEPQMGAEPPSSAPVALATSIALDPALTLRQTYLADVDGDGVNELVVGYGPTPDNTGATSGTVVTCTAANATPSCQLLDVPDLAGWGCYDAAPANVVEHQRFDPLPDRTSVDLVMLCHRGDQAELFHVFHDAQGFHAEPRLALPSSVQYVEMADVNGDGVEDALAVDGDVTTTVPVLRVYLQCTSRDVETCAPIGAVQ